MRFGPGRSAGGAFALAVVMLTGGCGRLGGEPSAGEALRTAERKLAEVKRGDMDLGMTATAGEGPTATAPVGFRLAGRFSVDGQQPLPILDLTYIRLLGDGEQTSAVRSNGQDAQVSSGGVTTRVPERMEADLRGGTRGGMVRLEFTSWVVDPRLEDGQLVDGVSTRRITGAVDVARLLSDMAATDVRMGGESAPLVLDEAARQRINSRARRTSATVLVGKEDGIPRQVEARAELAGDVPPELRAALGRVGNVSLEVTFGLRRPGQPVESPTLQ